MMAESATLILEMIDDQIVVTMPGTNFLASYRKRQGAAELVAISCKTTGTLPCPARSSLRAPGDLRLPKRESFAGSRERAHSANERQGEARLKRTLRSDGGAIRHALRLAQRRARRPNEARFGLDAV